MTWPPAHGPQPPPTPTPASFRTLSPRMQVMSLLVISDKSAAMGQFRSQRALLPSCPLAVGGWSQCRFPLA